MQPQPAVSCARGIGAESRQRRAAAARRACAENLEEKLKLKSRSPKCTAATMSGKDATMSAKDATKTRP